MKSMLIAFFAAGAVLAGTPAVAENVAIQHRDLDLSTAQGQKVLEQRIDRAAREVCGLDAVRTGTRVQSSEAKRCYAQAKAQAKKSLAALVSERQLGG